ncbi:hypothetical protein HK098_002686 [Nowakowskiella sp. JEL0407]|nr:hypothetical protein HK098_002686 [Nowakowskiella sp. JEL0407]
MSTCDIAKVCTSYKSNPWLTSNGSLGFMGFSGVCWTLAYFLYIRGSYIQGEYRGVPAAALFINLSWEFMFATLYTKSWTPQRVVNIVWFVVDFIQLAQFCYYEVYVKTKTGKYPAFQKLLMGIWNFLLFVTMWAFLIGFVDTFQDNDGVYIAFGQNLMMSMIFFHQIVEKPAKFGDLWVVLLPGVFRLLGTSFGASIAFLARADNTIFLMILYISIFVFDFLFVLSSFYLYWFPLAKAETIEKDDSEGLVQK